MSFALGKPCSSKSLARCRDLSFKQQSRSLLRTRFLVRLPRQVFLEIITVQGTGGEREPWGWLGGGPGRKEAQLQRDGKGLNSRAELTQLEAPPGLCSAPAGSPHASPAQRSSQAQDVHKAAGTPVTASSCSRDANLPQQGHGHVLSRRTPAVAWPLGRAPW